MSDAVIFRRSLGVRCLGPTILTTRTGGQTTAAWRGRRPCICEMATGLSPASWIIGQRNCSGRTELQPALRPPWCFGLNCRNRVTVSTQRHHPSTEPRHRICPKVLLTDPHASATTRKFGVGVAMANVEQFEKTVTEAGAVAICIMRGPRGGERLVIQTPGGLITRHVPLHSDLGKCIQAVTTSAREIVASAKSLTAHPARALTTSVLTVRQTEDLMPPHTTATSHSCRGP
jgi:hypothetical protein